MKKERWEGFQALAFLIEESNRLSSDPKKGRLLPKQPKCREIKK